MDTLFANLLDKGDEPTRADIAMVLLSIAPPGEKRDEKIATVKRLFEEGGFRSTSSQGHDVWDHLESYTEW